MRLNLLRRPPPYWFQVLLIAILVGSRQPSAILHPRLWAEDGRVWLAQAWEFGARSLFWPQDGYLQTISRLAGLLASALPIGWAPGIYLAVAWIIQVLPPAYLLSTRWDRSGISRPARVVLAWFLIAVPNSFEVNLNVTNAQWHLAILAFLIVAGPTAAGRSGRVFDRSFVALSSLSGPFALFLAPIAWWRWAVERGRWPLTTALAMSVVAGVQASFMVERVMLGHQPQVLGASGVALARIVAAQIIGGGLMGSRLVARALASPFWQWAAGPACIAGVGLLAGAWAVWRGPILYRQAAVFTGLLFVPSLVRPALGSPDPLWPLMAHPGIVGRYMLVPMLVWLSTALVMWARGGLVTRTIGQALVGVSLIGAAADWSYPPQPVMGWDAAVAAFDAAAPGDRVRFPEAPDGWEFVLVKR